MIFGHANIGPASRASALNDHDYDAGTATRAIASGPMSEHVPHRIERHCDVAIIGATAACMSAALDLRFRHHTVLVIDSDDRGDAVEPTQIEATTRDQVRRRGVEVLDARAVDVARTDDGRFRIDLTGGHAITARWVLDDDDLNGHDDVILPAESTGCDLDPGTTANETDWDQRYSGDQLWSGNPNGTLVNEISGTRPGRALDVGAGEGGDAIWLAEQGWQVTASDISRRALDHITAEATRRNLNLECLHVDTNALDPFQVEAFDLVTAHYASIPRTAEDRAIANMLGAVAPGGTLLVVGHDLEPMRHRIDTRQHSRMFDADAYVRVDDFVDVLATSVGWHLETNEKRPRPQGHASASHHVDDVVMRARRLPGD